MLGNIRFRVTQNDAHNSTRVQQTSVLSACLVYKAKILICVTYDLLDLTVGRVLFPIPLLGEIIGCTLCCLLFGKAGMFYALESIDLTEQIDGFIPTATLIALANKK